MFVINCMSFSFIHSVLAIKPSRAAVIPRDLGTAREDQTIGVHARPTRILPHNAGRMETGDRGGTPRPQKKGEGKLNRYRIPAHQAALSCQERFLTLLLN